MAKNKNAKRNNVKKVAKKINKLHFSMYKVVMFFIIALVVGVSFLFAEQLENFLNPKNTIAGSEAQNITDKYLKVHYIDVGQADATLLELPDGKLMLIDTGEIGERNNENLIYYLNQAVFNAKGNKVLDYLVLTHIDSDHIGGAIAILNEYEVLNVYKPHGYSNTVSVTALNRWQTIEQRILTEGSNVVLNNTTNANERILTYDDIDNNKDYTITFYCPDLSGLTQNQRNNNNNYSPVITIQNNGINFLFSGDAEAVIEKAFLNQFTLSYKIDVYKVGHHGSNTSSSENFIKNIMNTSFSAIVSSNNTGNDYGHPHDVVVNRLTSYNATIYRTDQSGSILLGFDETFSLIIAADGVSFNSFYIKWHYIAIGVMVLSVVFCFFPGKKTLKSK